MCELGKDACAPVRQSVWSQLPCRIPGILRSVQSDRPPGRVLILNGGSSAGKTTLGRKLQSMLTGPWLLLGIDLFLWMLPAEMISSPEGISVHEGVITRGSRFVDLYSAFQEAVATLARNGVDLILDEVTLESAADQARWDAALQGLDVLWVGVRCAPEIAASREVERGDRSWGTARQQATSVHESMEYDVEVDSGVLDLQEATNLIVDAIVHRWSIQIQGASGATPTLPPLSAWSTHESIRAAPWET